MGGEPLTITYTCSMPQSGGFLQLAAGCSSPAAAQTRQQRGAVWSAERMCAAGALRAGGVLMR
jgi:hypothetical protein